MAPSKPKVSMKRASIEIQMMELEFVNFASMKNYISKLQSMQ